MPDHRILVFEKIIEWIEAFARRNLQWFILENVKGIDKKFGGRPSFLQQIQARLDAIPNFQVRLWLLNSCDYFLPQQRARYYIVGVRSSVLGLAALEGIPVNPPPRLQRPPLHAFLTEGARNTLRRELTCKQRTNLQAYTKMCKRKRHSEDFKGQTMTCDLNRKPTAAFGPKMRTDDLIDTLKTTANPIWLTSLGEGKRPSINRLLTKEERARLQGFNPDLFSTCSETEAAKLIGNAFAVPVVGSVLCWLIQVSIRSLLPLADSDAESSDGESAPAPGNGHGHQPGPAPDDGAPAAAPDDGPAPDNDVATEPDDRDSDSTLVMQPIRTRPRWVRGVLRSR